MRNLTHYFKSPKESEAEAEESKSSGTSDEINIKNVTFKEDCPVSKKRKINLSKTKNKTDKHKININDTEPHHDNELEVQILDVKIKKSKKRKSINVVSLNDDVQTSKKLKLTKSNSSKSIENGNGTNKQKSLTKGRKHEVSAVSDCSTDSGNSSFDSGLAKAVRKKRNRRPISESDDEPTDSSKEIIQEHTQNGLETQNVTVTNNGARNSLLGYFNKVSRETILKERTCEKVKVEALVHMPSTEGEKVTRKIFNAVSKKQKNKNKKQITNYDLIEVISSEDIVIENIAVPNELSPKLKLNNTDSKDILNGAIKVNGGIIAKQTNLASIFISKKIEKNETTHIEDISKTSNKLADEKNKKETVRGNKSKNCEKVPDFHAISDDSKSAKTLSDMIGINKSSPKIEKEPNSEQIKSHSKKAQKVKRLSITAKNKSKPKLNSTSLKSKTSDIDKETYLTESTIDEALVKRTNKPVSSDNFSQVLLSPSTKIDTEVIQNLVEENPNEEIAQVTPNTQDLNQTSIKITSQSTPDKPVAEEKKLCDSNMKTTPKPKRNTINGYFSPNVNSSSSKTDSIGKSVKHKSSSPWVMKVRLSVSKSSDGPDSENEGREEEEEKGILQPKEANSKQNNKAEIKKEASDSATEIIAAETTSNKKRNDDIVLINDDEDSCQNEKVTKGRTRLSRSAKRLTYLPEGQSGSPKPKVKVWPCFQKGEKQTKDCSPVDKEKLKAKILFLESGVPEILKRKVESDKSDIDFGPPAPFPTVSHITQNEDTLTSEDKPASFVLPHSRSECIPGKLPDWTCLISTNELEEPEIPVFDRPSSVKAFLQKIKEEEPKTEVKAMFKRLKQYKSNADTDIWTEVYRPTKSADVVGNSENVKKLKAWLETFKHRRPREGSVSSGEEFANDDSEEDGKVVNNMAVLSGPCGCGKTCTVNAIAAELDYKVLEINASCNRSGKRILAEFSESTQSHQVERSQPINNLFKTQSTEKPKKKKRKIEKSSEVKSEKTSLILVEDADLLFSDADEGFMQALSSLAATAKRPLILVTNQTRNPHLERFQANRPLHLTFSKPKSSKIELWLRLIGLVEGVQVTAEQVKRLVAWSGCDIRRCLLQLQLMVHSNNSEVNGTTSESMLWWHWPLRQGLHYELPTLLEAEEPAPSPATADKSTLVRQLQQLSHTTQQLACLDMLSAKSPHQTHEGEHPCPRRWEVRCSDSTVQTHRLTDPVEGVATDLSQWLAQKVSTGTTPTERLTGQTNQEARWLSILRQSEEMFLKGVSSTVLTNHCAVACEYLPILRQIGRAEQVRLTNYSRRANRFFNYLQGLGIHASQSYRDFMCDALS